MRRSQQGMDSIAALEKAIQLELPLFSLLLSCALQIWTIAVVLYVARIKQQGLQMDWEGLLHSSFSMMEYGKYPFFLSMPQWS